jgi:hypothetical protein
MTEEMTMTEQYKVQRDGEPALKFKGEIVAEVSSSPGNASSSYSGQTGRWAELTLYKTTAGRFVCEQIGRTQWQGEHDRYSGCVSDDTTGVIEFFGHGWLAKDLYDVAGIEAVEDID